MANGLSSTSFPGFPLVLRERTLVVCEGRSKNFDFVEFDPLDFQPVWCSVKKKAVCFHGLASFLILSVFFPVNGYPKGNLRGINPAHCC